MQQPFDASFVRVVMILDSQGSDAQSGRSYCRFFKRVERLLRALHGAGRKELHVAMTTQTQGREVAQTKRQTQKERLAKLRAYDNHTPAVRRLRQAKRMFRLLTTLAVARLPIHVGEIHERFCERYGETLHRRTIYRDLIALESLGIAVRSKQHDQLAERWQLTSDDALNRVLMIVSQSPTNCNQPTALDTYLGSLAEPWEHEPDQFELVEAAARLVALSMTNNKRYLKADLRFTPGHGWRLQLKQTELNAFDQHKSLRHIVQSAIAAAENHPGF